MRDLPVRIYYEDTDHGGVVYHSNYLKFMERARTEGLRDAGIEQSTLAEEQDLVFAVSRIDIHFRKPAFFDDYIVVKTELDEVKGAKLHFEQKIMRNDEVLVEAKVLVACMSRSGKPRRTPASVAEALGKGVGRGSGKGKA